MKMTSTVAALVAGLGLSVLAAGAPTLAYGADLGGNCCADLEERVAELEATTARKGNRKMSLTITGWVNEAILVHDIGGLNKNNIIDNDNSESRVRIRGDAAISADWSAGYVIELGLGGLVNGDGDLNIRHSALFIASKQLGTFWLGKTSQATDGITEMSLAGNTGVTLMTWAPFQDHLERQNLAGGPVTLNAAIDFGFDGGRTEVIKYVSPTVAGFSLSASWAANDNDAWDVALRYAGEFGGIRVAAGIGYRDETVGNTFGIPVDTSRTVTAGSLSVMHVTTGLFLDAAYSDVDGPLPVSVSGSIIGVPFGFTIPLAVDGYDRWGVRAGVKRAWSKLGATQIYGEYAQTGIDGVDLDLNMYGVGIVQDIDAAAMQLYVSYRNYDVEITDVNVIIAGAKIRF